MPLSLEHSAIVIAVNVPELERRFRSLAEEISVVASHLADTEPERAQLTKLRDEIAFAAENLRSRSESEKVRTAAANLSSACDELTSVLFEFRRHHNGTLSDMDQPHPMGRDLITDLSDEIGDEWDSVVQRTQQPIAEIFGKLRHSATRIKSAGFDKLAPLYELDEFFATASNSVAALDHKDRFDKVQQVLIPKYRALFEKCCEAYPHLAQHFVESFDDTRFSSEMMEQRKLVREALKDIEIHQDHGKDPQALNEHARDSRRHPYTGMKLPGDDSGWHELLKEGVTLYGKRLKLQNKPARLLMSFLLTRKRLSIQDLSCVDDSWQKELGSHDETISETCANSIRVALYRLRESLRQQLGIPTERRKEITNEFKVQPTVWELNWKLLDEYGFAKGKQTQK